MVGEPLIGLASGKGQVGVYACVSSADQETDLDRQVARVMVWVTGQKPPVDRVVTEVGSAFNGHRKGSSLCCAARLVSTIVVEHRDRFARFGAEYVGVLSAQGRRRLVVDPVEVGGNLVRDVTGILTSLRAHLCGRRAGVSRVRRVIEALIRDSPA